jgi:predicted RNA-binding Zn-ribbon protein involved in translation (DUF1610 family)
MKNDFITLACPSCGGKLKISQNTNTVICESCGMEHLVRREAGSVGLESFAACPICHRNDKSQKVSTLAIGYEKPEKPRKQINSNENEQSSLFISRYIMYVFICIGVSATVFFLENLIMKMDSSDTFTGIGVVVGLILGIYLVTQSNKKDAIDRVKFKDLRIKNRQAKYETQIHDYERAIKKWNKSYYCQRDDIVYDIESKDYCEPNDFEKWLLKES